MLDSSLDQISFMNENLQLNSLANKIDKFIGEHLLEGITNKVFIITGHSKEMKILVGTVLDNYELYSQIVFEFVISQY